MRRRWIVSWFIGAIACAGAFNALAHAQGPILISVNSNGQIGTGGASFTPFVSSDGRVVAFQSGATNFDPADTNGTTDVYVRYLDTGQTIWTSFLPGGAAGHFGGTIQGLSGDGRWVTYSTPDAHVAGDTGFNDIYVRDLTTMSAIRASVTPTGAQSNGDSYPATISGDGRFVAFISRATNFLANDANGGSFSFGRDVFVRDLTQGNTELISLSSSGVQANTSCHFRPAISSDGRFVVFSTMASNLVPNDTNGEYDVFVRDRQLATTTRVSVDSLGNETSGPCGSSLSISSDGRYVVFNSDADSLVLNDTNDDNDFFVHDAALAVTKRVSVGWGGIEANDISFQAAVSGDGQRVPFTTLATNLLPFDYGWINDVLLRDELTADTSRMSVSTTGEPTTDDSEFPAISADGRFVAYDTEAPLVVSADTNTLRDVYLIAVSTLDGTAYCSSTTNSQGCLPTMAATGVPSVSAGGGFVLRSTQVRPQVTGMLIYGTSGPSSLPVAHGTKCVATPRRTVMVNSGGSAPCSGVLAFDFNTWLAAGTDPALVVGQTVWSQYFARDPGGPAGLHLTSAMFFVVAP